MEMELESDIQKIEKIYVPSELLDREENMVDCRPGGYHPVALGDMLKSDRYKIFHKLGHDRFSTVWVAKDHQLERWVSIKIITADKTSQSRELQHHRALSKLSQGHLRSKHIVRLFDDFILDGPNGRHQCLVYELLGPPVNWMLSSSPHECHVAEERLDPEDILMISTHLLEALTFLQENGYTHGDISVNNIAYTSDLISVLSEKELLKVLGNPEADDMRRVDGEPLGEGIPHHFIRSTTWPGYPHDDDDADDEFRLFDFGEAFTRDTIPEKLAGYVCLQSPEAMFTSNFDHRLDLWSVGLTICYLAVGSLPIHEWPMNALINSSKEYYYGLPKEWQQRKERLRRDAEEEYGRALRGGREPPGLELEVAFRKTVKEPELQVLLPIIKGLTKLTPSNRMSAGQALFLIGMPHEECYATDEGRDVKCY
ncbi:hypothetical protein PV11_05165 [Exophiala sideris]|uniref:non-specific serine/threonine protein kinase n=1 Tax=Exophiala sideris TaxID=1016849 RepID=A0A0D1X5Z2_9EURO|nr:hypothetical protein PV11_05165 [Exophiala sideris]